MLKGCGFKEQAAASSLLLSAGTRSSFTLQTPHGERIDVSVTQVGDNYARFCKWSKSQNFIHTPDQRASSVCCRCTYLSWACWAAGIIQCLQMILEKQKRICSMAKKECWIYPPTPNCTVRHFGDVHVPMPWYRETVLFLPKVIPWHV